MVFEIGRKTKTEVKKAIVAEGSVVAVPKEAVNPDVVKMPNGIYRLSDRGVKNALAQFKVKKEPYYKEQKRADGTPLNEKKFFEACFKSKIPLLLKGPTGCGKTRFIEHMAFNLGIPLVSVGCNEDTTAPGLVGMLLPVGDQIWWKD
ncbi:MAG: AAA family ATPase, partial [Candidatus Micrarchaeia archaeon]